MRVCVIGTGYVGLVTGVILANLGHDVVGVDQDQRKVSKLSAGDVTIYEPNLSKLLSKALKERRIKFTSDLGEGVRKSDIILMCVGTPQNEDGTVDMRQYEYALHEVACSINAPKLVVNKSTVPVGTAKWAKSFLARLCPNYPCEVVSNPEFLREGSAVHDSLYADRIVLGVPNLHAAMVLSEMYEKLNVPYHVCEPESAELIKYASNCFLAVKISYINSIAMLCDHYGADVEEVAQGMGADKRIGEHFLKSGLGYGGSCFPKDVSALIHAGRQASIPMRIVESAADLNSQLPGIFARTLEDALGGLQGRRVSVWGLAFKPNTDDMRDAQSVPFINMLQERGAVVSAYDPAAFANAAEVLSDIRFSMNPYDCAAGADALCVLTEWDEFRSADLKRVQKSMAHPTILDARNMFDPDDMRSGGWDYYGFGRSGLHRTKPD